ncbi:BofC C-terminal domain-containing protein [Brevibacillus sp. TJ4]|uniref:BofC C-terminal domain-containing protein n=1 Tax=Brevibacillus sp. TJ4 TaxID=3234853 RepID=UPI003BA1912C
MREKWKGYGYWGAAFVAGLAIGIALMVQPLPVSKLASSNSDQGIGKSFTLVLTRSYLCGVRDEEHKPVPVHLLADTMAAYKGWEIVSGDLSKLILLKREHDLSPECKENGHFGLSEDGILTLFHGLPQEQEVIQTFYRINTEKMEASLSKEEVENLKRGIRIHDLAEYHSVLSTYGEYQLSEEE